MIQRERENRERLKKARIEAERNAVELHRTERLSRREIASKNNRDFLESLSIPQYLQDIIDEEHLQKAYVLWWLKPPELKWLAPPRMSEEYYKDKSSGVDEAERINPPPYSMISLVWKIGYNATVYTYPGETFYREGGVISYRGGGGGVAKNGYSFMAVNVVGDAERKKVSVEKAVADPKNPKGLKFIRTLFFPKTLAAEELNELSLRKALTSAYLNTVEWNGYYEVHGRNHESSWPFDKIVFEQDSPGYKNVGESIVLSV